LFRLSFRFLLGFALVVVNVGIAAVVAIFAYRAATDAMVQQALNSVARVAESRDRDLIDLLSRRQRRLDGFLGSLEQLCGERNPSGNFGFERQCLRAAVAGLHTSEGSVSTDVRVRNGRVTLRGVPPVVAPPLPTELARIDARAGKGYYAMRTSRGVITIDVEFDLDDINAIFRDRQGLETAGEAFLTDSLGYRLTTPSFVVPTAFPVARESLQACLHGREQTSVTTDDRGLSVISGVRSARLAGAGCIVTNVTTDDATRPIQQLGWLLVYAAGVLGLLGGVVSMAVAGMVTRPIKRLAIAAHQMAEGDLDAPMPVTGPSEVRRLGRTLSRMASSIRDLVRSEQKARKEAEAASRTKDEFLATLSHELRTPLNAILGWASILSRTDYDRARTVHAVRVIERNAKVQSQMIEELLDVSRISAGRVRLTLTEVSVASAIDAAVESVRPTAEVKGVQISRRLEALTSTVSADPRRLQQILWNILSNAVRFTPAGGRVDVIARDVDSHVELVVQDTGCGIVPAFLPWVFERFRQADSSTTRAHGGLGLGLAIVKDLVTLHGGLVRAESNGENQGTTITVRLPKSAATDATEPVPGRTDRVPQLAGARVLVVDDDPDARDVLRTILENAGARVTTSTSARETRAIMSESRPDLLIADIGMPDEDGYSLIQSIRNLETGPTRLPAIALTAHSRPEDVEQALASGFQMHVAKPIDSQRLVASIASLFDAVA
jgi:signal transduction histidine kinase/ActR/RegA family two-component response regulator